MSIFDQIESALVLRARAKLHSEKLQKVILGEIIDRINRAGPGAGRVEVQRITPEIEAALIRKGYKVFREQAGHNETDIIVQWSES